MATLSDLISEVYAASAPPSRGAWSAAANAQPPIPYRNAPRRPRQMRPGLTGTPIPAPAQNPYGATQGDVAARRQMELDQAQYNFHHGRTLGDRVGAIPELLWRLPINPFDTAGGLVEAGRVHDVQSAGPLAVETAMNAAPLVDAPVRGLFGARAPRVAPVAEEAAPRVTPPPRELARTPQGGVLPVRPREPFRQSFVGGSADLRDAAQSARNDAESAPAPQPPRPVFQEPPINVGGGARPPQVPRRVVPGGEQHAPQSPPRLATYNPDLPTPTLPDGGAGAGGNAQQAYLAQLRSQGFDTETPLYRGHTGNPTTGSFRPSEGMLGEGVSLTHDPAQASRWAARNHNEAPTVHRVYIRGRIAEAPLTIEEARAQGYAGYRHRGEGGYDETAIFDPANIAPSLPDTRAPAVSPPQPPRVAPPRGPFDRPPQSNAFVGVPIFAKQDIAAAQRAISHPPQRPPASYRGPGGRMAALSRFAAPEMRAPGPRIAHHIVDVGQVNAVRPGHFGRAIYMDRDPAITTHLGDFGSTRAQRFDYRVRGALATPEQFERLGQEALQRQGYVGVQAPDYFAIWDKRAIGRASARGPLPNYSSRQRTTPSAAISEEHPLPRTSMYAAARRGPQASAQDKALATLLGVGGAFPTAAATANFATGQRREYQALDRMQRMNAEDRAGLQRYRSQETGPGNMGGKVGNKPQVLPQGTPKERAAALSELHSLFAGRPDIPITEDMIRRQIIVMREGLHGKIPNDAPAGMVR